MVVSHQHQLDLLTVLSPVSVSLGSHRNCHKVGALNLQKIVFLRLRIPEVQNEGAAGLSPFQFLVAPGCPCHQFIPATMHLCLCLCHLCVQGDSWSSLPLQLPELLLQLRLHSEALGTHQHHWSRPLAAYLLEYLPPGGFQMGDFALLLHLAVRPCNLNFSSSGLSCPVAIFLPICLLGLLFSFSRTVQTVFQVGLLGFQLSV